MSTIWLQERLRPEKDVPDVSQEPKLAVALEKEAKRDRKVALIRSMKAVLSFEPPLLSAIKTRAVSRDPCAMRWVTSTTRYTN